jgi:transcriptional regulator with XRE-family HTH domain
VRTYPAYIGDKARSLRTERGLTIDEIAERLAVSRSTVYYWVRDLPPLERNGRPAHAGQIKGSQVIKTRHRLRREAAYLVGRATWDDLSWDPSFRDFVCLYLAEGYKRSRNTVSVCNSDPTVVVLCDQWIRRLSVREPDYSVQYHADQDLDELREFWGQQFGVPAARICMHRKSNSSQLASRTWRCVHGVLTVRVGDTLLRAKLQGWMDSLRESWL